MYKDDINSQMPNHFGINFYFDIYITIRDYIFSIFKPFLRNRMIARGFFCSQILTENCLKIPMTYELQDKQ